MFAQQRGSRTSGMWQNSLAGGQVDWNAAKDFAPLSAATTKHLTKVYTALTGCILAAAAGSMFHLYANVGGLLTTFAAIGVMVWIAATPNTPDNTEKRLGLLAAFAFLKGASIGPLIARVAMIDPSIITTAFVGTCIVFACFSAASLFASKRSMLYLGGFLGSGLSLMVMVGFMNIFMRSSWLLSFQLYGGLLLFCGFIMFDTQMIVAKAEAGDSDYVMHSIVLFVDAVAIFVRLLIILSRKSGRDNERRDRRRR